MPPPLTPLDMTASEITSGLIHCDIRSLLLTSIDRCPAYHPLWVYYIQDLKQSLNFEITSSHFLLFDVLLHIICQEFNHTWRFSQIWIFYGHKYDLINQFIMKSVSHEQISLIQLCRNTLSLFHFRTINLTFSEHYRPQDALCCLHCFCCSLLKHIWIMSRVNMFMWFIVMHVRVYMDEWCLDLWIQCCTAVQLPVA